jgi:glutathione synthase/RimK-type ligase-like ATP-grasp enzyme
MSRSPQVLIAGGDTDPNLGILLGCLQSREVEHEALLVGAGTHPRVTWEIDGDVLRLDGEERRPAAVFIRNDVFTGLASGRPEPFQRAAAWFTTVSGWAFSHPEVRLANRASALNVTNKPQVLHLARQLGFDVPSTLVTNDHELLTSELTRHDLIVKPVNGGDYARDLREVLPQVSTVNGSLAAPAIIQRKLVPPEIRVYRIDGRFFPYQLVADALDYRSTTDCRIVPLEESDLPSGLTARLAALMDRLQMDFGAADFKACPTTGRLQFLEINNSPMFAAFDSVSGGRLSQALADFLCS